MSGGIKMASTIQIRVDDELKTKSDQLLKSLEQILPQQFECF